MNQYVTGAIIKKLRENCKITQAQLAEKLNVSDKAVSKWETGRGFPDISMLENLAKELGVSIIELLSGNEIINTNKNASIKRSQFYVCPVCGNVIFSIGQAVISCCGISLVPVEAEDCTNEDNKEHYIHVEKTEDEYFVHINHEMTKTHFISYIASVQDDGIHFVKLYPEMNAECRFKIAGTKMILAYCNRHGGFYRIDLSKDA